ncbi:MAG TPA: hypothetical protein DDW78_10995 [Treponema sp.]|nr:hypothetical protein [Treponema sp.]
MFGIWEEWFSSFFRRRRRPVVYYDAHFHIAQCSYAAAAGASCAQSPEEFLRQEALAASSPFRVCCLFGIHPQDAAAGQQLLRRNAAFLEQLLREHRICGIGECGLDFFTEELKAARALQEEAWHISLGLAASYGMPLLVHDRKALDELFRDSRELARLPSVIFHAFPFGAREALALLAHGVNAYFSFGAALLRGSRKAEDCVRSLPAARILMETDAPFQPFRDESFAPPERIRAVYERAAAIRAVSAGEWALCMEKNFCGAFLSGAASPA